MSRFYLWSRSAAAILAGAILGWILLQGLQLIVAWLPVAPIRAHLVLSVSNGSLLPTNYTWGDRQRGNEQFTDMAMLIPFITDRRGWRERALGPQMFVRKGSDSYNPAPDLVELLKTDMPGDISNPQARVDRYWYGPRLPMGILLQWMDLGSARRLLVVLEFLSVIAMLLVARRHRGNLFLVVAWLGIFGLLVGPIQFYGPSFAFGSPFLCANIFNIALLLYGRRTSRWPVEIELGCLAVAGAFAVYFDVLSGTVWFCLSYALICIPWLLRAWGIEGWKSIWSTGAALTAIGAGVVIPVFFKQVMSIIFLGGTPFSDLIGSAGYRIGTGQQIFLSDVLARLVAVSLWLGPGELYWGKIVLWVCFGLILLSILCSIAGAALRLDGALHRLVWTLFGGLFPLSWYIFMRNHTVVHAWFSVTWIYIPTGVAAASLHLFIRGILQKRAASKATDLIPITPVI